MAGSIQTRVRDARRQRALADSSRSGRYARSIVWERQTNYVRQSWRFLAIVTIGLPVLFVPHALWAPGGWRWVIVGASVASGIWAAVLTTVLYSGAAGSLLSISTEEMTAVHFGALRKQGWRLVNGFRLRPLADIDHVAVGPPGVFVLETKWSEDAWPMEGGGDAFMEGRLADGIAQVRRNANDVARHFNREIGDVRVHPVLVLWSGSPRVGEAEWVEREDVSVVRGHSLEQWLKSQVAVPAFDHRRIEQLWEALNKQVELRDSGEKEPPKPTLQQLFGRHLPLAVVGVRGWGL